MRVIRVIRVMYNKAIVWVLIISIFILMYNIETFLKIINFILYTTPFIILLVITGTIIMALFFMLVKYTTTKIFQKIRKDNLNISSNGINSKNNKKFLKNTCGYNILCKYLLVRIIRDNDYNKKKYRTIKKKETLNCFQYYINCSTKTEVEIRWKKLARQYHPDKYINKNDKILAEKIFKDISECKDILSNQFKESYV